MTLLTAEEVMDKYHYKKSTFYERRKECLLSDYQDAVILDGKTLIDKRRWEEFIKYRSEQKKRKLMGIDWGGIMERILKQWQHFLENYTDIELKSESSLLISLIVVIAGLGLMIYVLSMEPFLPGTIWSRKK